MRTRIQATCAGGLTARWSTWTTGFCPSCSPSTRRPCSAPWCTWCWRTTRRWLRTWTAWTCSSPPRTGTAWRQTSAPAWPAQAAAWPRPGAAPRCACCRRWRGAGAGEAPRWQRWACRGGSWAACWCSWRCATASSSRPTSRWWPGPSPLWKGWPCRWTPTTRCSTPRCPRWGASSCGAARPAGSGATWSRSSCWTRTEVSSSLMSWRPSHLRWPAADAVHPRRPLAPARATNPAFTPANWRA
mmetsp:Transcript_3476/g.8639  ORF Transcript_3476/g.8639 Transcript_3476/m.8639 type:complete len:243 (-) Transcript_3476:690-1418(-)